MSRRNYGEPPPQAYGCLILLIFGVFILIIRALVELFRYRPQPYAPAVPAAGFGRRVALPLFAWRYSTETGRDRQRRLNAWFVLLLGTMPFLLLELMTVVGLFPRDPKNAVVDTLLFTVFPVLTLGGIGLYFLLPKERAARSRERQTLEAERLDELDLPATTYTIYPVRGQAEYVSGSKLMRSLLSTAPQLTFQIVGTSEGITWQLVDPRSVYDPQVIITRLKSHLPAAATIEVQPKNGRETDQLPLPFYRQHILFHLANEYGVPLPFLEHLKAYDPLTAVSSQMEYLSGDERIVYSVFVLSEAAGAGKRAVERFKEGYIQPLTDVRKETERESTRFEFDEKLVAAKLSTELYHCYVVVTVESTYRSRLERLADVAQELTQYQLPGHNALSHIWTSPTMWITSEDDELVSQFRVLLDQWVERRNPSWQTTLLVLSPQEIAALWHLPNELFTARKIVWAGAPVPSQLTEVSSDQVCLGRSIAPGRAHSIYLSTRDRAYHQYLIGKTGMGKSTLLHNLIHQDIEAGRGVVVIDPHGRLIADILSTTSTRHEDILLLECGKTEYPVPINPLRILPGVSFSAARKNTLWALEKIYEDILDYPRVRRTLNVVLNALLCDPEATPLDVYRIFGEPAYRAFLLEQMHDHPNMTEQTVIELERFHTLSKSEQEKISEPIISRTSAFLGNKALELMTCHPTAFDFRTLMQERKIILIDLSGDEIETEAGNVATLFLSSFFTASQSMEKLKDGAPPRYYLYLDEAHRVMTGAVVQLLSEVRKFGLSLQLAHQFIGQLRSDVIHGIWGNVGTIMAFEVGIDDARTLAPHFEPEVERSQLVNLGAYHMAVKTRFEGRTLPAFIVKTQPPPPRTSMDYTEAIRARTRSQYDLLTEEAVRAWLRERYHERRKAATHDGDGRRKPPPKPRRKAGLEDFEA